MSDRLYDSPKSGLSVDPPSGTIRRVNSFRTALLLGKAVISILFLLVILRRVANHDFVEEVTKARIWPLIIALTLLAAQFPLAGWRWHLILRAFGIGAKTVILQNLVWVGQFINQVVPTFLAGDAVRGWYLTQRGISGQAALTSIVLDRIVGLLGLLLLILLAFPFASSEIRSSPLVGSVGWAMICGFLFLLICMFFFRATPLSRSAKIGSVLTMGRQLVTDVPKLMAVTLLVIATNVLASLAAFFVALGLGVNLTVLEALSLIPIALLAVLLPISLAGWGVREGAIIYLFNMVGIPSTDAFAVSVTYGMITLAAALPGGPIWIGLRDKGKGGG